MAVKCLFACQSLLNNNLLTLNGLVGSLDGSTIIKVSITGAATEAESLGEKLAAKLLAKGADKILAELIN